MPILFDMKTITTALGIGYLLTLLLIAAYWRDKQKMDTIKILFLTSKATQTTGWFLAVFRDNISDLLSISIANSLMLFGLALEVIALLRIHDTPNPQLVKLYLFITAICIASFQYVYLFHNEEHYRIVCVSMTMGILLLPTCRAAVQQGASILMRIIGSIYMVVMVAFLYRGMSAWHATNWTSLYHPSSYQLISIMTIYLALVLSSTGFVLLLKDQASHELIRLASYDSLTNTFNRRAFTDYADKAILLAVKQGTPVSYLLFDIDKFKQINDTHGHHAGDQVLQDLVHQIKSYLCEADLFVRYGGDEFGILLPGHNEVQSDNLASAIMQKISQSTPLGAVPLTYTISLGVITVIPNPKTRIEHLYTSCDKALYHAKRNGRNRMSRSQLHVEQKAELLV
ncbi:diguanylate cyclase [Paenibacillus sp. OV219]|uniref:GGDEF domain-containing protein n=1 Tax=Paenibacillus sp. OV219 TaxID=1884377 RepID=UPI0008B264CC|nr:GGDEF domain-containing protein [Paenibacillus sp. OV219]SEO82500.1 diguanylate cyclase [Paenibacillus sp. OV219]